MNDHDESSENMIQGLERLSIKGHHRIIVGIDYGTTFTGISYIETAKAAPNLGDVHVIGTFPGRRGDSVCKVPSRIAYKDENKDFDEDIWGFKVDPGMVSYSWTKLLLDQNARTTKFDDPSMRRIQGQGMLELPSNKTAKEVVSDYLKQVYQCTMDHLAKRLSPELLAVTPLEFWFTVPAIWSDQAKEASLSAATAAGFGRNSKERIYLISEPEAAAYATLKTFADRLQVVGSQEGDGIIICDCGGGTVDLTSYKIVRVSPIFEFEELVEGIGGKCGSTYIDRQFYQWMSAKFGSGFDDLPPRKTGPGSKFMKEFESHKLDFGSGAGDINGSYEVALVMEGVDSSDIYDDEENVVRLSGTDMLTFFEPVVAKIVSLLDDQVTRVSQTGEGNSIKQVVLVGGFGDSDYLNGKLRSWCKERGIVLLCPENPQAAIARGAALCGLEYIQLLHRKSRRHYGVATSMEFREGIDPQHLAYTDKWTRRKMCKNRIDWKIAKGQAIDEETMISEERHRTLRNDLSSASESLYACSEDIPPDYTHCPEAEHVAYLEYRIDASGLKETKDMEWGVKLRRWHFELQVFLGQKRGTLGFKVVSKDGQTLGTSQILYD